ncbi:MAG: sulfotransferase [Candidatus Poseidoniia archaeon]|jgi:tetratricopeptide (TPR) repeat protein|nr:sulfotransferase [Candidatus Poseidoniia archaeon]|tara:strand:- start:155 stop:2119 length:1965 start_codon:yes stop_codon:yes gene_type:complete
MCLTACNVALKRFPKDVNLLCLSARANISLRLFEDAKKSLDEAILIAPDFIMARDTYGDLLFIQGQPDQALKEYQYTLQLDPSRTHIEEKIERAKELQIKLQTLQKKAQEDHSIISQQRLSFEEEMTQAREHKESGRGKEAEDIYRSILKRDPNHVEAARLLARIAMDHERYHEAEILLMRVVKNAPDYARAWIDLANTQNDQDKHHEATKSAHELLRITPESAESYMLYAGIIGSAGRHEAAIIAYEKAIKLSPQKAGAFSSMAHHLKTIGRQDEAIAAYRHSIAIKPDHTESYWSLVNLKTFQFKDEEIDTMQALLLKKDLSDESRVHLHNALGLEYESRKEYQKSFDNMTKCNQLRRKAESYDPVETESLHQKIITIFNAGFFEQDAADVSDVSPIFIVGLPRSGSTLLEQILASHTQVEGTYELSDLSRTMQSVRRQNPRGKKSFPESLEHFNLQQWVAIGQGYLESTQKYRTDRAFFVDKNPNNFTFIGALKLALPNAKIINARRHPLDSCYGSYKQLFASGQSFSYDLVELGEYYLQYQNLMEYWHQVLPNFILDVHYENVVNDLETEVERILDFCGLPFEEHCLRFHETERAVKTASSEQVRQPLYSSSVNLWRNYENNLGDLIEILKPLLIQLPKSEQPLSLQTED